MSSQYLSICLTRELLSNFTTRVLRVPYMTLRLVSFWLVSWAFRTCPVRPLDFQVVPQASRQNFKLSNLFIRYVSRSNWNYPTRPLNLSHRYTPQGLAICLRRILSLFSGTLGLVSQHFCLSHKVPQDGTSKRVLQKLRTCPFKVLTTTSRVAPTRLEGVFPTFKTLDLNPSRRRSNKADPATMRYFSIPNLNWLQNAF